MNIFWIRSKLFKSLDNGQLRPWEWLPFVDTIGMVECHDSKNRNETFILRINVWTVNAVIAELVMQDVEMRAINTSPVSPKWWRRYVDDSSACLKRSDVQLFHQHINSINPYIQFTVELPTSTPSGESIALLGTQNVPLDRKAQLMWMCTERQLTRTSTSPFSPTAPPKAREQWSKP